MQLIDLLEVFKDPINWEKIYNVLCAIIYALMLLSLILLVQTTSEFQIACSLPEPLIVRSMHRCQFCPWENRRCDIDYVLADTHCKMQFSL